MTVWVDENWESVVARYKVTKVLHESKSLFQNVRVVDTAHYGHMLVLDGMVQTTEKDEFIYHEMMAHVPLLTHPNPKRVLIIGGGDGGVLREVLRHPGVEKAVQVEIDKVVIDVSREFLPTINGGAFDDPRAEVIVDDGAKYMRECEEPFDVVIVDSSDPIGPAKVLFVQQFYNDVFHALGAQGIMTRQTGSSFMQPPELPEAYALGRNAFPHVTPYFMSVPTYIGGLFCGLMCSKKADPRLVTLDGLTARTAKLLGGPLRYYTPGLHMGALEIPGYIREHFAAAGVDIDTEGPALNREITFGWELQLDLYDCDQAAISTGATIQQYAKQLCQVIDMKAYGEPQTPYFGEQHEHTKGFSLLQFIETSSITGHFSEGTGAAYINVFSCKPYDAEKAAAFTKKFFGARHMVSRLVTRK
ncbi:MAG: polyamine aminopropyltransferase [Planctomycetota bacterium]|jgi:spermidine synthase